MNPAAMSWAKGAFGLSLLAVMHCAATAGLVDVWRAAVQNDKEYAVDRADQATAAPRRDQASSLWRPSVGLTASAGVGTHETQTRGAQFSAPGLGQSTGVGFDTSVANGSAGRWAIVATQPLYNPVRRAQQSQLNLSADLTDLQWQAAGQALMLRTAQRYFDLVIAEETVGVLRQQLDAVQHASMEAQDRFKLGSVPVTDTHEARARMAGVRAQLLAAESVLQIQRSLLADSTGLAQAELATNQPDPSGRVDTAGAVLGPLEPWLNEAQAGNPTIRAQVLATEVARQDAAKYSRQSSPTVDLVVQAGHDRLSGSGDYGSASNAGTNRMIGVQLSIPLFTGGYRDAMETEALRTADKAQAEVERTRQQVAQQVRAAWLGLSVGVERVQSLEEALTASMARRDATRTGLEVGQRTTLDLLNAEADVASTRLALAQARVGLVLDRLRLAALAGHLDEDALRAVDGERVGSRP